jgi:hypothetical protein
MLLENKVIFILGDYALAMEVKLPLAAGEA